MTYLLLDCGDEKKLEQFGPYVIERPASVALWKKGDPEAWKDIDASFSREKGNLWRFVNKLPRDWTLAVGALKFKIAPTDFGHLGLFPEHFLQCEWMAKQIAGEKREVNILNLFAYSGAATLFAAKTGAGVCHLDASKGMIEWARENAQLSGLERAPIRWIIDDVFKFLKREARRGVRYDGIILDPPSYGRGSSGECFKIERDVGELLSLCADVLSEDPLFVIFSAHTPGLSPLVMGRLLKDAMHRFKGKVEDGEMVIKGKKGVVLPSGTFARWKR